MTQVENPMINYKEEEPKVVAHCTCCNEELTEQETFVKFLDEYFCDEDCVFEYHELIYVEGWELD
jgi:hypothetical protein